MFANPQLQIQATNGAASISWTGTGYWLQAADYLGDPIVWYNSPWVPLNGGPQFQAAVPIDSPMRFFRLVSSPFLPPPTGLNAQAGDSLMFVTWNAVSNALSYNLYFSLVSGVNPTNYTSLPGGTVLTGITHPQVILDGQTLVPGARYYFVATTVDAQGESTYSNEGSDLFGPQGQVHGSFFTPMFDGTSTNQLFVPGVNVSLQSVSNGMTMAQATTDDEGVFSAAPVPAGTYQLCWSAPGFISGCSTQQVIVSNDVVMLDPQEIDLVPGGTGVVFGQVTLPDGSIPVFDTDLFGASLSTTLTLMNSTGKVVRTTSANAFGDYLFVNVPLATNLTLTASAEAASISTNIDTSVTGEADLVLPNTPPVIQRIAAFLNGQMVNHAPTDATVQITVTATDEENDFLHYAWLSGPGAGGLVSVDSSNLSLTLPGTNGLVEVFVEVSDVHGGYVNGKFDLIVEDQLAFSGYVADTNGNAVVGAAVSVNSSSTLSDTNGFFQLALPQDQNRIELSITAQGFAPFYEILNDSDEGETYYLTPLGTICTNWTGSPMSFSDSSGAGTTVELQANSLDSAPGVPYFGPICVSITTYDPCADLPPYPAGNIAIDNLGNTNWITPQATAFVSITDPSGEPLLINPSLPATLILPLGQTCAPLTNLPCALPAWVWDPGTGVWRVAGMSTNQAGDCASGPFAGPMLQMGMQAVAQPAASCQVAIEMDKTINLPIVMRVSSQAPLIEINDGNQAKFLNPGVTVPVNKPVTFQLLSPKEAPNDFYPNPNDPKSLRLDKDKTVIWQLTKTFTKDDSLTLGLSQQIPLLTSDRVDKNGRHFLIFGDSNYKKNPASIAPNLVSGPADEYYSAIGFPVGTPFIKWLQKNGFINPPNGSFESNYVEDAAALYFNATDLGFGRSMHMKTKPGVDGKTDIAYYVVNYLTMQDTVARPISDTKSPATVAMDYAATITTNKDGSFTTNRYTKFYIFSKFGAGFNANLPAERAADLDGAGGKILPNLCVTCHGSAPLVFKKNALQEWTISPPNGDVKGYFIPFDPESFTYKPGVGVQQAQFRELNRGIYQYTPLTDAMKELISGWYAGGLTNGNNNNFTTGFVPGGWTANAGQKSLYTDAVRISCRGCHTMRPNISFNTFAGLNGKAKRAETLVCTSLQMPNAQRTFTIFWGSMAANVINNGVVPDQPKLLKNQFNWGACPAKP